MSKSRHACRPLGLAFAGLVGACLPVFAWAQENKPAPPSLDYSSLIQLIVGLLAVLAFIGGLAWFMKRFGGSQFGQSGPMKVVAGVSVGTRERVVLLQVGEKQVLLGVAPGRVQTLHVLDEPLDLTATSGRQAKVGPFAERLRQAMQQQHNEKP